MKNLVIVLIAVISLSGCGLIGPKDPEFYCKIDGKKFIPQNDDNFGGVSPLRVNFNKTSGSLWINAINSGKSITLYIKFPNQVISTGTFRLESNSKPNIGIYAPNYAYSDTRYNSESGNITITKFTDSKINGTFEFTGIDSLSNKKSTITEGKFDTYVNNLNE